MKYIEMPKGRWSKESRIKLQNWLNRYQPSKEVLVQWMEYLLVECCNYQQYAGHWDGDEWQTVTMQRQVRTKLGVAFVKGDVTLQKKETRDEIEFIAFSFRNMVDTLL